MSGNLFVYKFLLNFLENCLVDRSTIERMHGSRYSARKSLVLTADARASIQAFERRFFAHTVRQQIVMGAQVWSSCVTPAYRTMDRKDNHIHIRVTCTDAKYECVILVYVCVCSCIQAINGQAANPGWTRDSWLGLGLISIAMLLVSKKRAATVSVNYERVGRENREITCDLRSW